MIAITKWSIVGVVAISSAGQPDARNDRDRPAWRLARPSCRPTSPGPFFAHDAPPPRGPLALIGIIAMLSETVPGPADEGGHVQLENEGRRIERRRLPRRSVAACPTCHSPHNHALAIDMKMA